MMTINRGGLLVAGFLLLILVLPAWAGEGKLTETADLTYQPNPAAIRVLQQVDREIEIVLFHGAWCADCRVQVPRFMRILQLADNPRLHLTEYEVNPQKRDVLGKFEEYGVQYVPTFIVRSDGRELGRITEKPQRSLEEDFAAILAGTD